MADDTAATGHPPARIPEPPDGKKGWPWIGDSVAPSPPDIAWPRITIVTPSYNQGAFLEQAIRSVLLQGYPNLEYIVMDGGSTDESVSMIRKYEPFIARWRTGRDRGQSDAINLGFQLASGEILGWLNSDDLLLPGALFRVAETLQNRAAADWMIGGSEIVDGVARRLSVRECRDPSWHALLDWPRHWFPQQSTFWTSAMWKRVGPLDASLHYAMDFDLWMRMLRVRQPRLVPSVLAQYRHHGDAKCTRAVSPALRETARVALRHLGATDSRAAAAVRLSLAEQLLRMAFGEYWHGGAWRDIAGNIVHAVRMSPRVLRGRTAALQFRALLDAQLLYGRKRPQSALRHGGTRVRAPRRIGFISTMSGYGWGGSEELWSGAAHRLLAQGHPVATFLKTWHEPVPSARALADAGAMVFEPPPPWRPFALRLLDRVLRVPPQAADTLELWCPDFCVISLGWFQEGAEWAAACRRLGIPYAIVVQAAGIGWWGSADHVAAIRDTYESARRCFFVSAANLETVNLQLGTVLSNAEIVSNPFNVPYDGNVPWPRDGETWRLACVARLDFYAKGLDLLVEVLRRDKWRKRNLSVSLFGSGGCRKTLERLKERHDLQQLHLLGHVSPVTRIWEDHHALLLPSRLEGMPLALIEAMLCARPAIVTAVSGNAELIEDGVTGFVAAAPTPDLLDDAMERAWARRADWHALGECAASAVRRKVPPDPIGAFVQRILDLGEATGHGETGR